MHRTLTDPSRATWRPGRAKYLLSIIAKCGKCGYPLVVVRTRKPGSEMEMYTGGDRRCTAVKVAHLDEYAERIIVAWLSRADVFEALSAGRDDAQVAAARAGVDWLAVELEQWVAGWALSATVSAGSARVADAMRHLQPLLLRYREVPAVREYERQAEFAARRLPDSGTVAG